MTQSNHADQDQSGSFANQRRTLLKALGAGTGVALMSGVGAADGHGDKDHDRDRDRDKQHDSTNGDEWCPPCIDRLAGYTALADDDEDEWPAQPDHTVDLYVEPRHILFEQTPTEETDVEPGVTPGEPEEEDFPDFFFSPVGLHIEPGDVVDFYNESEAIHTVTAFTERFNEPPFFEPPQRIPDDAPPFSSPPLASDEHWLYRFDEPGVYDVLCLPHYELGMVARLVVAGEDDATPEEPGGTEDLPTAPQTVFNAPEMTVENILDVGSVAWDDLTIDEQLNIETLFEEEEGE
jgi:plastocyanin